MPAFGNFSLKLRNAATTESKEVVDKEVTLVVERHGRVLQSFYVIDGDILTLVAGFIRLWLLPLLPRIVYLDLVLAEGGSRSV